MSIIFHQLAVCSLPIMENEKSIDAVIDLKILCSRFDSSALCCLGYRIRNKWMPEVNWKFNTRAMRYIKRRCLLKWKRNSKIIWYVIQQYLVKFHEHIEFSILIFFLQSYVQFSLRRIYNNGILQSIGLSLLYRILTI